MTSHPRIMRAREALWPWTDVQRELAELDATIRGSGDSVAAVQIVSRLVPEYAPDTEWAERLKVDRPEPAGFG